MTPVSNVTIGADPELFIINKNTEKVVSSIGLIPGEKGDPWVGDDMPKGFGLEIDNILAEFNIPPVTDEISFINNIEYMKNYISGFVANKNPELGILCAASQEVPEDQLQSDEAKRFGCSVDYNAYTGGPNPKPQGENTNLRSAGFHIHIGYRNFNADTSVKLVKYLDQFLGIPSIVRDKDTKRRSLYGKAGCFRLTSYGVEYRVLSSALMKDKESLSFVWNKVQRAIDHFNHGSGLIESRIVTDVINNSRVDKAQKLIDDYGL